MRFRVDAESLDAFRARYGKNVTQGGLSIVGSAALPLESQLRFTVELKTGKPALKGTALVRWCVPVRVNDRETNRWRLGLKFVELDLPSRQVVGTLLVEGGPAVRSPEPPAPEELSLLLGSWGDAVATPPSGPLPMIAPMIQPAELKASAPILQDAHPPAARGPLPRIAPMIDPVPAKSTAQSGTKEAGSSGPKGLRRRAEKPPAATKDEPLAADIEPEIETFAPAALEPLEPLQQVSLPEWMDARPPGEPEESFASLGEDAPSPSGWSSSGSIGSAVTGAAEPTRGPAVAPVELSAPKDGKRADRGVASGAKTCAPPAAKSEPPAVTSAPPGATHGPGELSARSNVNRGGAGGSGKEPALVPAPRLLAVPGAPATAPVPAKTANAPPAVAVTSVASIPGLMAAGPGVAASAPASPLSEVHRPAEHLTPRPAPSTPRESSRAAPETAHSAADRAKTSDSAAENSTCVGRALEALHRGDFEIAEAELQQAIALAPKDAQLRHELGLLYARWDRDDGHDSAAESCFARACELDPNHVPSLIQLGEMQLRRRLVSEAKRTFERALRIDPNLRAARRGIDRVHALMWRGRLPKLGSLAAAVALLLGGGLWLESQPPRVITVRTPIVRTEEPLRPPPAPAACPPTAVAAAAVPVAAAAPAASAPPAPTAAPATVASRGPASPSDSSEPREGARSHHERRTARRGHSGGEGGGGSSELAKLVQKGDAALRSGRVDDALAAYNQAIAKDPKFAPAHRGLGSVYVMQGRDADAKAAYQKYLALAPHAPDAPRIQALLQDM